MKPSHSLILSLLFILSAFLHGCNEQSTADTAPKQAVRSVRVKTGKVIRDSIPLPLFIPGKLSTAAEIKLAFKTGGIIRQLKAREGATIARGTFIASLDTVEFTAWRDKANTAVDKATRDLTRAEQLFKDNVATLEQLQNARSALSAAQSDLSIATFNLSQASLSAPSNGRILKRLAEKGEVIGPGMPVVLFASTDGQWLIKASIPDRDLPLVTLGDSATVTFDALPRKIFTAHLSRIAGSAHPVTGTFEVDLSISGRDSRFRPGLIADVQLFPSNQRAYSFIPAVALVNGEGSGGTVYAVDDTDSIIPLRVTFERLFGDLIAVSEGLEGISTIITDGAPYVFYSAGNITIDRTRE